MPKFGTKSLRKLSTCHPLLQEVMNEVIKMIDITVVWGYRGEEIQNHFFEIGTSTKQYPDSKHNQNPSWAIDIGPWPLDWQNEKKFILIAGYVMRTAHDRGIMLRWGGDWDMDWNMRDQKFHDLGHFELMKDYKVEDLLS